MKHILILTALLSLFGAVAFAGTPTNSWEERRGRPRSGGDVRAFHVLFASSPVGYRSGGDVRVG